MCRLVLGGELETREAGPRLQSLRAPPGSADHGVMSQENAVAVRHGDCVSLSSTASCHV